MKRKTHNNFLGTGWATECPLNIKNLGPSRNRRTNLHLQLLRIRTTRTANTNKQRHAAQRVREKTRPAMAHLFQLRAKRCFGSALFAPLDELASTLAEFGPLSSVTARSSRHRASERITFAFGSSFDFGFRFQ